MKRRGVCGLKHKSGGRRCEAQAFRVILQLHARAHARMRRYHRSHHQHHHHRHRHRHHREGVPLIIIVIVIIVVVSSSFFSGGYRTTHSNHTEFSAHVQNTCSAQTREATPYDMATMVIWHCDMLI